MYSTIGIDIYQSLYMCRYTDTVTKMYKYMHIYTHPQYTLTYVHLGLHMCTNIQIHRHTHNIYILDASKAFDRIDHWLLYKKLISKDVPLFIIRLLVYWYSHQQCA